MRSLFLCLTLVLGGACGKGAVSSQEPSEPAETAPSEQQSEASAEENPEAALMHERFLAVNAIRDSVIAGDLAAAQSGAGQLAASESLLNVLVDWAPYAENLQKQIEETAGAADLGSAAAHTAAAARSCGRCHEALGITALDEQAGPPPIEDDDMKGIMRRHRWASSRMWEGLIAPSDAAWQAGAEALVEVIDNAKQQPEVKSDNELQVLLGDVEKLAIEATESATGPERTQVYGQLLSTCSACHQKVQSAGSPGAAAGGGR